MSDCNKMSTNNNKCQNVSTHKEVGLHYSEIIIYSLIWVSGVIYSIYRVYLKSQELLLLYNRDLIPGWGWLGLYKDSADAEWSTYLNLLPSILFPTVINILLADIIADNFNKQVVVWFHVITSCVFSICFFGIWPMILLQCQLLTFHMASLSLNKYLIWVMNFITLVLLNNESFNDMMFDLFDISNEKYVLWCITIAWNDLRATSYALDYVNYYTNSNKLDLKSSNYCNGSTLVSQNKYSYLKLIAYCGFLPTMITGPIILYDTFEKGLVTDVPITKLQKYKTLVVQIIRYVFWLLLTEFMLHFLYTNTMEHYPHWVELLSPWEMYGYGYLLGQFFLLKYVVIYGIAGTLTRAHEIEAPRPPKCIARIHRYSDMWRYFDPGLHSFLLRYVYIPSRNIVVNYITNRLLCRICASFLCFTYIYVWHGTKQYILLWSILNYIAVSIETLADAVEASYTYRAVTKKLFSYEWQLRLNSMMTCPLLAMSAISNFYFFAGLDVGNIFLKKFLFGDYTVNLILFGFLYSACNVSHKIKIWENIRLAKKEKMV